ncbi:hypothetical protein [Flavobacterium aquicola]|uniref:Carboxypeptidase family protein n=1 Tax=Flavobacterium aquicola TaxID=1682742 RepID=A0A3E0EMR5_9FLAO|nr:hypothetical protein [Flavobacterium aquicola]REG98619.1 hypothetical protein C8P67_106228 [Flavobacterium aquicola]
MEFLKKSNVFKSIILILIFATISCSEEDKLETHNYGSIKGNVQLYDLNQNKVSNYDNLKIELIDSKNNTKLLSVDSNGNYQTDECEIGEITLTFTKPGFSGIKSIKRTCTKELLTIENIRLVEDVPFPYNIKSIEIKDGWYTYTGNIDPDITGDYMVTEFFFLGKDANVSCSNFNYYFVTGVDTAVSYINKTIKSSQTFTTEKLLENGFKYGDTVYITCYIISPMNQGALWDNINNKRLTIESFNFKNPSNTYSTILTN